MGIPVLVADDHEIVRYGLCLLLQGQTDIEVVGQAANAQETLRLLGKLRPSVVLLDLYVPGADDVSLVAEIRRQHPRVRIVVISGRADEGTALRALRALRAGAMGFVRKEEQVEEIVAAIRAAAAGQR